MRLVYSFKYRDKHNQLSILTNTARSIYNTANSIIKDHLDKTGKYFNYYEVNKLMKKTDLYRQLKAQVSQQILRLLDTNWKAYFRSIKHWKKDRSKFRGMPKPPGFKRGRQLLIYTNQSAVIRNGYIHLAKGLKIRLPQKEYKKDQLEKFNQIRILPKRGYYRFEIVYIEDVVNKDLDPGKYASIDIGVNNLITLASSEGRPLLFNGRVVKSYNQFYNKRKAYLMKIKDKSKIKGSTKQIYKLEEKRNDLISDYFHKISRAVVNFCLANKIANLVVGYNRLWKDSITLGKRNNQLFSYIPFVRLINLLKYKAELVGIKFIEVEESYTSKVDALALEPLQKAADEVKYLGRRLKRGLFQSSVGKLINADVNGALNILRKVFGDSVVRQIADRGLLFRPVKIRLETASSS